MGSIRTEAIRYCQKAIPVELMPNRWGKRDCRILPQAKTRLADSINSAPKAGARSEDEEIWFNWSSFP